ncbi:MAG TPA: hypothetical protein VGC97_09565 [Pyrinomonadaceae bacterium]
MNFITAENYRIFRILLKPGKTISLKEVIFSERFKADFGIGEHSIKRKYFTDSNGLYYFVSGGADEAGNGNLMEIQYGVPENLREEGFTLIQIEDQSSSNL